MSRLFSLFEDLLNLVRMGVGPLPHLVEIGEISGANRLGRLRLAMGVNRERLRRDGVPAAGDEEEHHRQHHQEHDHTESRALASHAGNLGPAFPPGKEEWNNEWECRAAWSCR